MRSLRATLVFALLVSSSCSSDVGSPMLAINDPLALIDDVQGPLRLFVLPSASFTCDATTGMVSPDVPDVAEGMFGEATADLSLTVSGSRAMAEVAVPGGDYTVLVRGKGTDPVTMRTDVFIATGCGTSTIAEGETREVRITLLPILGEGLCGDGTLSPDEQCEDGNSTDGDGCTSTCRTEAFQVNTTTAGVQNHPTVGSARGHNWTLAYDSDNATFLIRSLNSDGSTITTPSVLTNDADVDDTVPDVAFGSQLIPDVAVASDGRIAIAFADFRAPPPDIRVVFFDSARALQGGGSVLVRDGADASDPTIAFAGNGAAMLVYTEEGSATGLMGVVFASGATMPAGAPFEVGTGLSRAGSPDVAGTSDGFVVAMTGGGDLHMQRFGADGAPRDAAAVAVAMGPGTQDQPAVGAMPTGEFLVTWRDELLDGAASGVGARAFGADGAPTQEAFVLNTTTDGPQEQPSVAVGPRSFAVAFVHRGSARARMLSAAGDPLPNQESPPTTADFEVSSSAIEVAAAAGGSDTAPVWMAVTHDANNIFARFFPFF